MAISDRSFRVPVFTYHGNAMNIQGTDYHNNDHVALQQDLRTLNALGYRIVPLLWIVEVLLGTRDAACLERAVGLSFDDGPDHDFLDWQDAERGAQQSFFSILRDFGNSGGRQSQPDLQATCFVIASAQARTVMAQRLPRGIGRSDNWWQAAEETGLLSIHNHSWDHLHPILDEVLQKDGLKGDFAAVNEYPDCHQQVTEAARYICSRNAGRWPSLFAYPWGHSNSYLREVYFPEFVEEHKTLAAFSVDPAPISDTSSRWNLPRYVCGSDWRSTEEFKAVLRDCC